MFLQAKPGLLYQAQHSAGLCNDWRNSFQTKSRAVEVNGWLTALSQEDKTPGRRQKSSSCNATFYIVWSPEAAGSKVRALRIYQSVTSIKNVSMKFGQGAVSGVSEWVSDFFTDSGMWRLKDNGFGGQWKYSVKNIEELFRVCLKFSRFSLKSQKSSLTECWKEYLNTRLSKSCCSFTFFPGILLYISVIKQWFNLKVYIYIPRHTHQLLSNKLWNHQMLILLEKAADLFVRMMRITKVGKSYNEGFGDNHHCDAELRILAQFFALGLIVPWNKLFDYYFRMEPLFFV